MSQLALLIDDVVTQTFPVEKTTLTIGRSKDCDICIDDVSVSTRHAELRMVPSELLRGYSDVFITDLGSRNGTFVNDDQVTEARLKPNDVIRIGWTKFKYFDDMFDGRETTVLMMLD